MSLRTGKTQYTETEAAEELGVSVERLRVLIRRHIITSDEDLSKLAVASFQRSDLLLLRLITAPGSSDSAAEPAYTSAVQR
jgi:hypothetical protein